MGEHLKQAISAAIAKSLTPELKNAICAPPGAMSGRSSTRRRRTSSKTTWTATARGHESTTRNFRKGSACSFASTTEAVSAIIHGCSAAAICGFSMTALTRIGDPPIS